MKKIFSWSKRFILNLASTVYASVGWLRIQGSRWGLFETRSLPVPVICVGDLILGGSGKTPAAIFIASHLRDRGDRVAILCRVQDEAAMIEKRLPDCIVLVGRKSYDLGRRAVDEFGATVCVMDGGYQHLGLKRDLNILLIASDFFSAISRWNQIRREPISGIRRADLCLVTKISPKTDLMRIKERIHRYAPGVPVFQGEISADSPRDSLKGKRVFAFSGIADDRSFMDDLRSSGALLSGTLSFSDHHRYTARDYRRICKMALKAKADLLVTTEKDFGKIRPFHDDGRIPLICLKIKLHCLSLENEILDYVAKFSEKKADVIAPNFNRRFSGVTASILSIVPALQNYYAVRALGNNLPRTIPTLSFREFFRDYRKGPRRIWHARRNVEMLAGIVLKKILGFPLILLWTSAGQRRHTWLTRFLYRRMDEVIATTDAAASYLVRPSVIIPHGTDTRRFHPPADRRALWEKMSGREGYGIGLFGRVRPNKGTGDFVEALCEILPSFPKWSAVIVGETTPGYRKFQRELQGKIDRSGLKDRILFLGKLDHYEDVVPWYQAVSLVVAPPWVEGFGLTPLEGMACGCPVIATRTGAFPQIIEPEKNGWIVPLRDRAALRKALESAMKEPQKLSEMGRLARQRMEECFSIEKEAENLAKVYEEVFERS